MRYVPSPEFYSMHVLNMLKRLRKLDLWIQQTLDAAPKQEFCRDVECKPNVELVRLSNGNSGIGLHKFIANTNKNL